MIFLSKAWAWIKKYWKWILFPVGILVTLVSFLIGRYASKTVPPPAPPDLSKPGEEAVDAVLEAAERRDKKLQELYEKNQDRLEGLSDEQEKELEALAEKPIEEVVAWFDKL